jgi:hypothetical protein
MAKLNWGNISEFSFTSLQGKVSWAAIANSDLFSLIPTISVS